MFKLYSYANDPFLSIVAQCQLPLHQRQRQLLQGDVSVCCIVMVVAIHFSEERFVLDGFRS